MLRLHYAGYQPNAFGFGWATCNSNLRSELDKRFELIEIDNRNRIIDSEGRFISGQGDPLAYFMAEPDVCFMPLINHDFDPTSNARGKINLAYTFFEFELGPNAAANAAKYDVVFAGSTWCLDRMRERGITNGELLIQGVDNKIFKPFPVAAGVSPAQPARLPLQKKQFRIFSGGKFEYRKGQDLVIAAFKKFCLQPSTLNSQPQPHLVCSWHNPWPQLITQDLWRMNDIATHVRANTQEEFFASLLVINGLSGSDFTILPQLSQTDLAAEMQNTDLGLFPNRCEGGTNLVLMEYLSCGKPAVANILTGHADIKDAIQFQISAHEDRQSHWAEQTVEDIVSILNYAYKNRDSLALLPSAVARPAENWTWSRAAETIMSAASRCLDSPARA